MILMLTVAIGTFSSVLQATIERSQVEACLARGRGRLPDRVTERSLRSRGRSTRRRSTGVDAVAGRPDRPTRVDRDGARPSLEHAGSRRSTRSTYPEVLAGSPVALGMPPGSPGSRPTPRPGRPAQPDPGGDVVGPPERDRRRPDRRHLPDHAQRTTARRSGSGARSTRSRGSRPGRRSWSPRSRWSRPPDREARSGRRPVRPGPGSIGRSLESHGGPGAGRARVVSRYERYATLHDAPLVPASSAASPWPCSWRWPTRPWP